MVIRNTLDYVFRFKVFDRAIDVFGNAALSIYLAIALLSLKLWELADLAGPLVIILAAQTVVMLAYVALVTFRVMGAITTQPCCALAIVALAWARHRRPWPRCRPSPTSTGPRTKRF